MGQHQQETARGPGGERGERGGPGRAGAGGRSALVHTAVWAAAALVLAGCAVTPQPLSVQEQSQQAQADLARLMQASEAVKEPVTVAQAVARAIRHNLEFKVRQMEESVQAQQLDLSSYDMLPRLALQAGYSRRSNDAFGLGYTPNGSISAVPSAASEREHSTFNAALSWNILDFGLSYYRARQNADQVMIAQERRRRALQNLVLEVQLGWWRAEAAQRLLPQIDAMLAQIDRGAERSRMIEARRLLPPLQIIAYRRSLLDLQQQLSARRQDLVQWRGEFAELMGLRPGESYRVAAPPPNQYQLPDLVTRIDDLEAMALERRPELGEERYRARITQVEGKRQLLTLLPSLNLSAAGNYDSNRFLVNNQWSDVGSLVTFNLLKLLSLPAMKRTQEASEQLDRARREAVAMAVMTQTRIAVNRYQLLRHELGIWNEALADDRSLLRAMKATQESGLETELELIRAAARQAITEINRDVVHANLEHAMGRIMNSVGHDVLTAQTPVDETPTLASQMEAALGKFVGENYAAVAARPMESIAIGAISGVPEGAARADFVEAMRTVLRVVRIPVADKAADKAAVRADVVLQMGPRQDSGRPVELRVTLLEGTGQKVLHSAQMKTMLVEPITPEQWKVLGEAAMFRVAEQLRGLLGGGMQAAAQADTFSLTEGGMLKLDRRWTGARPAAAAATQP